MGVSTLQVGRAENFHGSSRFDVLRQVGQGGVGSVYEAIDKESGTHVALKTLRTSDPESILLLKNEFRSIQDLDHANLVTPRELFEADGQWFFSMEFVEGTDFLTYVRSSSAAERQARLEPTETLHEQSGEHLHTVLDSATGACDEAKLRGVLRQLAMGVCALHAEHKVHRDLKPSNVLVDASGQVRILDFGIVWDLSAAQRHTDDEGAVVGTVAFMAPEQAGGDVVTPAADWYAVGVMLYQALTGRLPFVGSVTNILTKKSTEAPPAPSALDPTVPQDLSALCADLLKIEPSERPEGFEVLRRLGVTKGGDVLHKARVARFVGRAPELAAMNRAFDDAGGGKAVTLLVEGESGVGKSWLVREFTSRVVAESRALVLRGRCYERESVPYKAVDSVIDDLAKFLASLRETEAAALLPEEAPLLRTLFPVLETIPAVHAARITRFGVKSPQEARAQMFALLRTLLVNVALYRRLVVVIDDLQWADADSLALLSEVLRPPAAPPLLLLASIRSATSTAQRGNRLHDALGGLPGDVRWVHLDPLPEGDARALIRTLLANAAGTDVSAEAVNDIYAEAHGHPLFIDELVRHRALQEKKAPARLDDALFERATRLNPAARKLLELVAVAGVPLPQQIATKAAAMDFAQVYAAIGTLRAEHFVRTSGVYRHDTVEAYHDRVRHSMLAHLDDGTKREWHGRLALALEQSESFDPERLIAHWLGAGEKARAAGYAIRAADDAAAALAFDHAASLYQTALDLGAATGEEATALRVKMAEALANAGRGADAAQAYLAAAGDDTSNAAIDLRRRAAEQLFGVGHVTEGIKTIGSVLRAVGISWAEKPIAVIFSILFYTFLLALRGLGFKSRKEADIEPTELLRIDCLASAGTCGMTDHVRGRLFQVRTLYEALRVGEPARIGRAMAMYAAGYASAGVKVFDKTMDIGARVTRMGETRRDPALLGLAELVAGYSYFLAGRFAESCAPFERGEVILRDRCVGMTYPLASGRALHYRALTYTGQLEALAARVEPTLAQAESRGDLYSVANYRATAKTFLALAAGDTDAAAHELELAAARLPTDAFHIQHYFCMLGRSQLAFYLEKPEDVREELVRHWKTLERSMLLRVQTLRIGLHDAHARACLALLASGEGEPLGVTRETTEREIRALERERTPWALGYALLARAALDALDGNRARAISRLEAAEKDHEARGLVLLAAGARRRRGELVGGAEGDDLVRSSEERLRSHGVAAPARFTTMLLPEFARR